jgi:hypothetical protein
MEWMKEWVSEWLIEWMNEGMSEWVNEWMNKWIREWMWLPQAIPAKLHEFVSVSSQCCVTQSQYSTAEHSLSVHISFTDTECSLCL